MTVFERLVLRSLLVLLTGHVSCTAKTMLTEDICDALAPGEEEE